MVLFQNRRAAGKQLAPVLKELVSTENSLVLGLPRGGVPVAYEVAKFFNATLDTLIVRKLGMPFDKGFGFGAIGPHGVLVLQDKIIRRYRLSNPDIEAVILQEDSELYRRKILFNSGVYSKNSQFDTVFVIDDGLATGVTAEAAIYAAQIAHPSATIVFGTPVCSLETALHVKRLVHYFVCLHAIEDFGVVEKWYEEFSPTTDQEVIELLARRNH